MTLSLQFPSEGSIVAYLKKHPSSDTPELSENKVIQAVAKVFGDRKAYIEEIDSMIMHTLLKLKLNLNETVNISCNDLSCTRMLLRQALEDCADGKAIKVKKTSKL